MIRTQRFKLIYLPTKLIVLISYNAHFMNMGVVMATSHFTHHALNIYYFSKFSLFINLWQYYIDVSYKNNSNLTIYYMVW